MHGVMVENGRLKLSMVEFVDAKNMAICLVSLSKNVQINTEYTAQIPSFCVEYLLEVQDTVRVEWISNTSTV